VSSSARFFANLDDARVSRRIKSPFDEYTGVRDLRVGKQHIPEKYFGRSAPFSAIASRNPHTAGPVSSTPPRGVENSVDKPAPKWC
jgi:hypothetical protein